MKVLLTGTSGNLGSRVLYYILDQNLIPSSDLIISTSSPHKVSTLAKQNEITIVSGDFTEPEELLNSYTSAEADVLFLVSYPSPSVDRWLHHKTAIDAAKKAGIKLIVYTSLMFGGETGMKSIAGVQQAHIKTVEYLQQSGLEYIVVREGIYAESWWLYAGFQPKPLKKGDTDPITFVIPDDGPVAWVSWDDLGEGTAQILARVAKGNREWIGKTLNLTGPKTYTLKDIASLVEKYSGRTVHVDLVGRDEAKRYHLKDGQKEEWLVDSWSGWFEALKNGECAVVDPLLENILERKVDGMEELAKELFSPR